jgi:hypothetical protein
MKKQEDLIDESSIELILMEIQSLESAIYIFKKRFGEGAFHTLNDAKMAINTILEKITNNLGLNKAIEAKAL